MPKSSARKAKPDGIDNHIYDRLADTWWQEGGFLNLLKVALNPPRFEYLKRYLPGLAFKGKKVLEVGCGGGLFLEELAKLGGVCTGIDPSKKSISAARKHAAQSGLKIAYKDARGEKIPFPDKSFDFVACVDVLEHVNDLPKVIQEISRVLKPGGYFLYDTFNKTLKSKLIAIKVFQEWKWTAFMEPNTHDWGAFIRPDRLERLMRESGLTPRRRKGLAPRLLPPFLLWVLNRRARGKITLHEAAQKLRLGLSWDQAVMYIGHAVK